MSNETPRVLTPANRLRRLLCAIGFHAETDDDEDSWGQFHNEEWFCFVGRCRCCGKPWTLVMRRPK